MNELNLNVEPKDGVLVVRTGAAEVIKEANKIEISGDIETVANFLKVRKPQSFVVEKLEEGKTSSPSCGLQIVNTKRAVILVDASEGSLELQLDPENPYGPIIKGKLEESDELEIFNINTPKAYRREELIKLFRFNKIHFAKPSDCIDLVAAFQKFSAKAIVDMVQEDDQRGNAERNFKKQVETKLPQDFILRIPVYKGQSKETFRVEICLDVTDGGPKFWFESPELVEIMETRKEEIIKKQLESCTGFVVVNK